MKSKIQMLFFLLILGIVLYYAGKDNPFETLQKDCKNLFDKSWSDQYSKPTSEASLGISSLVNWATHSLQNKISTTEKDKPLATKELNYFFPKSKNEALVYHQAFVLNYAEEFEQASWVIYKLVKAAVYGKAKRSNFFLTDNAVSTGSATYYDYARSGYDRGHLCPAADFRHSKELEDETFYMSNMSPQNHDFNAGIWNDLENKVRSWVKKRNELIIVTGPVLKKGLKTIGKTTQIAVPEEYYKIIFDPESEQAIAFLMPNAPSIELIKSYALSIDELELKTKIDFFEKLPDHLEQKIESNLKLEDWY
jgi:endonuclease G